MENGTSFTWLHISDIHFGHTSAMRNRIEQNLVCNKIIEDAGKMFDRVGSPDFIFVTGDVAFSANHEKEYSSATTWLNKLADTVKCKPNRILIVPGNHDVDRGFVTNDAAHKLMHDQIRSNPDSIDEYFSSPKIRSMFWPKFESYAQFVASFERTPAFISEVKPYWTFQAKNSIGDINIIGLNTAILSFDNQDGPENLVVGAKQIEQLTLTSNEDLTIVLLHHPLHWLKDGNEIANELKNKPHIILCGHVHKEDGGLVYNNFNNDGVLQLVAGAGHADDKSEASHGYCWGRLSTIGLEYFPRSWMKDGGCFDLDRNKYKKPKPSNIDAVKINKKSLPQLLSNWLPTKSKTKSTLNGTNKNECPSANNASSKPSASKTNQTRKGSKTNVTDSIDKISLFYEELGEYCKSKYWVALCASSGLHEELENAYCTQPYDFRLLKKTRDELNTFMIRHTKTTYQKHFDLILRYYNDTIAERPSNICPRICVKSHLLGTGSSNQIIPVHRNDDKVAAYDDDLLLPENNTGFEYVRNNGEHYYCNNIPKKSNQGLYENPRLNANKAKAYKVPASMTAGEHDSSWIQCWNPIKDGSGRNVEPNWMSCYKSTLIFPICISSDDSAEEFNDFFNFGDVNNTDSDDSSGNVVIGYLCLDHVETDFFNKELDVRIGRAAAGSMLLFLLTILNYTKMSPVYVSVSGVLSEMHNDQVESG